MDDAEVAEILANEQRISKLNVGSNKMTMLSKNKKECKLCGNPDRRIFAKSMCQSCYNLERNIKNLEIKIQKVAPDSHRLWIQISLDSKNKERETRIWYRNYYWKRKYHVDGMTLEFLLKWIAGRLMKPKEDCFHGIVNYFDQDFSQEQRDILFKAIGILRDPVRLKAHFKNRKN